MLCALPFCTLVQELSICVINFLDGRSDRCELSRLPEHRAEMMPEGSERYLSSTKMASSSVAPMFSAECSSASRHMVSPA